MKSVSYGLKEPSDAFAIDVEENIDGVKFVANVLDDIVDVKSRLYGEFSVYNLLAAMTACKILGISGETLAHAVRKVKNVKGRFSVLPCEKARSSSTMRTRPKDSGTCFRPLGQSQNLGLSRCSDAAAKGINPSARLWAKSPPNLATA